MNVFQLRQQLAQDYADYASSFVFIRDERIKQLVKRYLEVASLWPEPLIQLNPTFESGGSIQELVDEGILHPDCARIFVRNKAKGGQPLRLHRHQREAIEAARAGQHYILTTGTGSGKSLSYIIPSVDHVLRRGSGRGIQAIIVYPMNALANSQAGELEKFLREGYEKGREPVTFARYTGQEDDAERRRILSQPPDILLTNYVMLELIMTRPRERDLISRAEGLRFLVLDELHTYRGRQGADVALLVRRVRDRLESSEQSMLCVGTSATLASDGSYNQRRQEIARVASQLFGVDVQPQYIIGETLQRITTNNLDLDALITAVQRGEALVAPHDYDHFVSHPLSVWIENFFGLKDEDGRLVRQPPRSIDSAAKALSRLCGVAVEQLAALIQRWLLAGSQCQPNPKTGFAPFAFRLHQFISPGDTVYSSLELEDKRYLTLQGQRFVPGDRDRLLYSLCFCRECGQEYYSVRLKVGEHNQRFAAPRAFSDRLDDDEEGEVGYLYIGSHKPWPEDSEELLNGGYLPDDWIEERQGRRFVRPHRRDKLPRYLRLKPDGQEAEQGIDVVYLRAPFDFCLNCGVAYAPRQSDFAKLATLSSEGRSSATTLLSLSAIRALKTSDLPPHAQKLLSFTDNRQDASLQAGHFNDFVEVSLLRGAIYRAVVQAGAEGLRHEAIAEAVFNALNLPLHLYASDPAVKYNALQETQRALRQVLGYRIYRDLRRGWRVALPNLEQCGLLEIDYIDLEELCADESVWADKHAVLAQASVKVRAQVARTLLDYMRRELAIKVDYLNSSYQERIQQLSSQRLIEPWAIDEDERLESATILLPRSSAGEVGTSSYTYASPRSGFGMYLRRTLKQRETLGLDDAQAIIVDLLEALRVAGLVEVVLPAQRPDEVHGYQLVASAMRWRAGTGERAFQDPIRTPSAPQEGSRPNAFFVNFYRHVAEQLMGLEAREHTAQVPYAERELREQRFRSGALPILYCSPTMELGVDIAELNVVNLRNVPPTPANYAQRSGRAGRSGQPALVFTYCSIGSPHDQYFFRRPERMVAGAVAPPRLDLNNEELVKAHLQAIWLAETNLDLGETLQELLDMTGDPPSLTLKLEVRQQIESPAARERARQRGKRLLKTLPDLLNGQELLDITLHQVAQAFDNACERWRGLYLSALRQVKVQEAIRRDPTRSQDDKRQAERLRREALSQIDLLTQIDNLAQSDFYSYRYFATEGFLPGYSFPRLPLSAFIPARRASQRDNFLSRPRFLAISEFGPRAIIYHEGSRYLINRIIMPVAEGENNLLTTQMKVCMHCGWAHPSADSDVDLCERCARPLGVALQPLLRLQNVVTRRRDRINADEEERLRLGYDIRTALRFDATLDGDERSAAVLHPATEDSKPNELARLSYSQTARLWRINLGWARRQKREQLGFVLDVERGYWARNEQSADDPDDPLSERCLRVIPYVEDRRSTLLFEPRQALTLAEMASLQAALKRAIEAIFQLEDSELAAEPLPDAQERRLLLFYEAAEGGAGVLRRLVDDPQALREVAREALRLCHFDPDTGQDQRRHPRASEDCEAACYDCLLNYGNQREHALLDRHKVRDLLLALAQAHVDTSPSKDSRQQHFERLLALCQSDLEREWLQLLQARGLRLPDAAQLYLDECRTRPDFVYRSRGVYAAIYIDGSHHDGQARRMRDQQQETCLEDYGYQVVRFGYRDNWEALLARYANIFGGV